MQQIVRGAAIVAVQALVLAAGCGGQTRPAGDGETQTKSEAPETPTRVIGYLAAEGVRSKGVRIAELPAAQLTHVFYAFARVTKDGRMALGDPCLDVGDCPAGDTTHAGRGPGGNFAALRRLKERHPTLKVVISVGGWSGSARFSDVALSDSSRRSFVASGIDVFFRQHPGLFDGIDVDWEFPVRGGAAGNAERPEDRQNFTLLLAELRRQLDAQGARDGRRHELSIAASAHPSSLETVEIDRITPLLDFVGLMTYDYHNGSKIAHFNSPLRAAVDDPTPGLSVDSTVRAYLGAGVPRAKLVVGVPFYGRAVGGVAPQRAGLFARATAEPTGWDPSEDADYRVLARTKLKDPSWIRSWHEGAQVPWLYHPATRTWISYDDPRSVAAKARYAREQRLGGVLIWELGADDGTLLPAVYDALRGAKGKN
jgi:GH18 family chitinase